MTTVVQDWFLAAYPKTLVSIVNTGKVPDELDQKMITLFKTKKEALSECPEITKTNPTPHQAFILKLQIPFTASILQADHQSEENSDEYHLKTLQIDINWIVSAHLYTEKSEKLFLRFFDSKFYKPIDLEPEEFKPFERIVKSEEKELVSSSSSLSLLRAPKLSQIIEREGDLLNSKMQTLVNTVNCFGVMGKGIALAFKKAYPEMFEEYRILCQEKRVKVGEPYLYEISQWRKIVNFPTKNHWQNDSEVDWIKEGLALLAKNIDNWAINSIALPPLGCGNGKLSWAEVKPMIYFYLQPLGIQIEVYTPSKTEYSTSEKRKNVSSTALRTLRSPIHGVKTLKQSDKKILCSPTNLVNKKAKIEPLVNIDSSVLQERDSSGLQDENSMDVNLRK